MFPNPNHTNTNPQILNSGDVPVLRLKPIRIEIKYNLFIWPSGFKKIKFLNKRLINSIESEIDALLVDSLLNIKIT